MKKKALSVFLRICFAFIAVASLLLALVNPLWLIGAAAGVFFFVKAPKIANRSVKQTSGSYTPQHEQYVLLSCPDCGKRTACADLRAAVPGARIVSAAEALKALGPKKMEEIDDEYDSDADIEDCAYCPACGSFFDPTEQ